MIFEKSFNNKINNKLSVDKIIAFFNYKPTSEQIQAINNILTLLTDDSMQYIGIYGYAGTGKTYIICNIIKYLSENTDLNIALTAPTNKAVIILEEKYKSINNNITNKINFLTIHKLFGYKTTYQTNGELKFELSQFINLIKSYDLIVIDECSMINSKLTIDIYTITQKYPNKKFIFLGDPAQLPPVNEQLSLLFSKNIDNINIESENYLILHDFKNFLKKLNKNSIILTKIMRNRLKNLTEFNLVVRKWVIGESKILNFDINCNSIKWYSQEEKKKWINTLINYCNNSSKNIKYNSNIILCYTNKATDEYNNKIRNKILGTNTNEEYVVGDTIIFNKYYFDKEDNKFYTSEQAKIISIKSEKIIIDNSKFKHLKLTGKKIFEIYVIIINNMKHNKNVEIKVVKNKHIKKLESLQETISNKIKNLNMLKINNINKIWEDYNNMYVNKFAEINMGFSITCHKSQGSTFTNVFIDLGDLNKNPNEEEKKKCIYTACSRASRTIHILI